MGIEQEKIKITFTCSREIANEMVGALEQYSGMTPDIENERENEDQIIKDLMKVCRTIERASTNNKAI